MSSLCAPVRPRRRIRRPSGADTPGASEPVIRAIALVPDRMSPPEWRQSNACPGPMVATEQLPFITSERVVRTVLFVDVVESVRLMEEDEDGMIHRWLRLVDHESRTCCRATAAGSSRARATACCSSSRDVQSGPAAAFAIQAPRRHREPGPARRPAACCCGSAPTSGQLIADEHDVYGRGVNLAARLTTLAGPGEIVGFGRRARPADAVARRRHRGPRANAISSTCTSRCARTGVGPPGPRPVIEPGDRADAGAAADHRGHPVRRPRHGTASTRCSARSWPTRSSPPVAHGRAERDLALSTTVFRGRASPRSRRSART